MHAMGQLHWQATVCLRLRLGSGIGIGPVAVRRIDFGLYGVPLRARILRDLGGVSGIVSVFLLIAWTKSSYDNTRVPSLISGTDNGVGLGGVSGKKKRVRPSRSKRL